MLERRGKRRSNALNKHLQNTFDHFFAQTDIEVTGVIKSLILHDAMIFLKKVPYLRNYYSLEGAEKKNYKGLQFLFRQCSNKNIDLSATVKLPRVTNCHNSRFGRQILTLRGRMNFDFSAVSLHTCSYLLS